MAESLLCSLPAELIHKILDNLDVSTIFLSFRHVCKLFYTTVNIYNRYKLDLSIISKNDFHCLCRIIRSENVISLTLSDNDTTPGQIRLFMSMFNINQFVHLRSLTLIQIEKTALNRLMKHVKIPFLQTLSINIRKNNSKSIQDISIVPFLSTSTIVKLQKLDLTMWGNEINKFTWPKQCLLQHLTIGHYITCKQVCIILSHLSYLRTLVLKNGIVNGIDQTNDAFSDIEKNRSLTSLTFKNSRLQMNELELILSLTPCLVHLQLTGSVNSSDTILDGSQWEDLIQTKLPLLKTFEFFFRTRINSNQSSLDIETWIIPFRTQFWLQYKSWFVTCDFVHKTSILRLYTLPICDSFITYESDFEKITYTTCAIMNESTSKMMNVREVELDLTFVMANLTKKTIQLRHNYFFENLTELILNINGEWPSNSIEYLSTLTDLSKLTTLGLYIDLIHSSVPNTISNIGYLLQRSYNVRSLTLANSFRGNSLHRNVRNLCSIIPTHVKHLDIYDMDLDDIKQLLTHLKHLSSIAFVFFFEMPFSPNEIIRWLSKRRDFTYLVDSSSFSLWLGNDINMSSKSTFPKIDFTGSNS